MLIFARQARHAGNNMFTRIHQINCCFLDANFDTDLMIFLSLEAHRLVPLGDRHRVITATSSYGHLLFELLSWTCNC